MTIPIIYIYGVGGLFLGQRAAQPDPADEGCFLTDVLGGTLEPPPSADGEDVPYWTGTAWELRESQKSQENRKEAEKQAEIENAEYTRLRDPAARLAELADIRWQRQITGIAVNGVNLRTDRESIIDLRAIADRPAGKFPLSYKAASGFVTLETKEQAARYANAQDDHVQACFDREAVLSMVIINLADDQEALASFNLEEGWGDAS